MKTMVHGFKILVLILFLFSFVHADDNLGQIAGHVYSTPPMLPAFIPLPGANVYLSGNGISLHVVSDVEGMYQFNDVMPGKYMLSADAKDHLPNYNIDTIVVEAGTNITDADIYLTPYDVLGCITLSGFVWEKDTDTPVHPAYITVFPTLPVLSNAAIPIDEIGISVVNNPDGSYKIENLPRGTYHVMCMAKGYHAQFITNLELKSNEVTLNFYLEPLDPSVTNLLAGTVFNEQTNTPVSNAIITLTNLDGPEILYRTRTNREGYYQFTSIYPGNYELSAVARGFQEFTENIEIRQNSWITNFNIYLKPIISDILVTLYGNVWEACSELKAVYPAQIILIGVLASGDAVVYYTENNPDGSYKIENIIPSTYLVICAAPGYQTKIIRNFPLYQPLHQLDFYLSPITHKWGYIAGKVFFDRLGTPVHGAKIRFISENAKYHHTASDIDGKYIARLPVGKYYVLCSYRDPNGYNYYQEYYDDVHSIADATPVAVEENQITPHIDFGIPYPFHQLSVTISGRVTDNDDIPLGKALVKAWQINVPSFSCDKQIYFAWTDDDGKYEINFDLNLHNMTRPTPLYGFIVSAEKDDYKTEFYDEKPAPYLADILWIYQDTVFTDIDFTLDPKDAPNSISGTITSADDIALAHAFVLGVNSSSGEIVFTYSNNLGQYTLGALGPDYYYLLFIAPGHVPEFYNDVHNWEDATPVLANGTVEGIDASLTPIYWDVFDGIVAGKVCDNTGRALAGVLITVKNEQGLVIGYTLTDNAGGYEITGISDGNYQVFATKVNYVTQISPIDFNSIESEMLMVNFTMDKTLTKLPDNGNDQTNLPTTISLLPNYPNPFNPLTHIQFAVPSAQRVRLVIYDILGRQVKNVLNDMLPAGWYTVQWDATDNRGEGVSSGVYFYSMETAEQCIVKKLIYYK